MQKRITLDWDFKEIKLRKYYNKEISIYQKETGNITTKAITETKKGFHVIIWLKKPISNVQHFYLRVLFGDDFKRAYLDLQRLKKKEPINILFNKKRTFYYKRKRKV